MSINNFLAQGDSRFVLSGNTEGLNATEFDLLDIEMGTGDHAGMDVFSDDNGYGGHGTLEYHEPGYYEYSQEHISAPPGYQHLQPFHVPAVPTSQDQPSYRSTDHVEPFQQPDLHDQVSEQDPEQVQSPDVDTETITESVERSAPARVEEPEPKPKKVADALKTEDADSDDQDFEEDSEDEEGDENDDEKKKRRKYREERILTRWNTGVDQLFLLALIYELELRGVDIPWAAAALHVNPASSAQSVEQHLTKVRRARIYYGMAVPPPKTHVAEELAQVTQKIAKVYNTITFTKPGHEEKVIEGTPGSIPITYTPRSYPNRPDLPHYGDSKHPLVGPVNKDRKSRFAKGKSVVKKEDDNDYVENTPVDKKSNSSKKVSKSEKKDSSAFKKPPARKPPATPSKASKPQGVIKSKKTPSSISKPLASLALNSPLAVNASKKAPKIKPAKKAVDGTKTGSSKKGTDSKKTETKTKTDKISGNDGSTERMSTPVLLNGVAETGQTYGRVSKGAPAAASAQLENFFEDIPEDRFTLGRADATKSYESDSTVISEPSTRTTQQLVQPYHQTYNGNDSQLAHPVAGTDFAHGQQSVLSSAGPGIPHNRQTVVQHGAPGYVPGLGMECPSQAQWNFMMRMFSQNNQPVGNAYFNGQQGMGLNTPAHTPRDDMLLDTGFDTYHTAGALANGSNPMMQQPQQYLQHQFQQPSLYQPQPQQAQPYFTNNAFQFGNDDGKLETDELVDPAISFASFDTNNTFPPEQ
ncbi:hypothetical protein E4T42_07335 [Aureobasidium subglaciale]|nr:hypothetical protein E4T42_07335 [Aureobasidium subglaciale]